MRSFELEVWLELFSTLRRNKLRTALTACGVFWGILMLVVLLGFGHGLELGTARSLLGFTSNTVVAWGHRTSMEHRGLGPGRWIRFDNADTRALQQGLSDVVGVAASLQLGGWQHRIVTSRGDETGAFGVLGQHPLAREIDGLKVRSGRFLDALDIEERRKVVVIGKNAQRLLFEDGEEPVGQFVKIQGVHFLVVGVVVSDLPGERGERLNGTLHVPLSTLQVTFNMPNAVGWFSILAKPDADAKLVEARARRILIERHAIHPEDKGAVGSYNGGEEMARVSRLFASVRFFIWVVGIATLCAGALGVSNIMLVAVKERTREIGVRKALGATPWDIIAMVLREAVLLTSIAGYVGLVVGVMVLELSRVFATAADGPLAAPEIDLRVGLVAMGVLALTGLIAGVVPAHQAAKIHPVVALRYE